MKLEYTGSNLGGLCRIEVVPVADVASVGLLIDGVYRDPVTLEDGASWEEVYFTQDTAHFVETPVVNAGSEHWRLKVKWRAPKDSTASTQFLMRARKTRYVAKLTQTNGLVILAGSKEEPCVIRHTMKDLGQSARDSNHYIVELDVTRRQPAGIYIF